MICSSTLGKGVALALAVATHGALAVVLMPQQEIRMEGQAGGAEARLGSSFADMAAGTLTAVKPENRVAPEQPLAQAALQPQETIAAAPPPQRLDPVQPVETPPPPVAQAISPRAAPAPAPRPAKAPTAAPERAARPDPTPPETRRPEPERIEARDQPKPEPKKVARPVRQGNSDRDARAGQATGRDTATANTSGGGGRSDAAGNAAASNYPGVVMRKLSRVPRPRIRARGAAVVAFQVASNGRLAGASVARSSGSAALDQAALRLVQRASPFPPPPQGAQRRFSIRIEGR